MYSITLPDLAWQKLYAFLKTYPGLYPGNEVHTRRFVEAVLWISRTGAQWRTLPHAYGKWNSVYKRFARWSDRGVWRALFAHFATEPDTEWLVLDSTIVRAHPCAAGAQKKTGDKPSKPSVAVWGASAPKFIFSPTPSDCPWILC
jgi:transposase